VAAGCALSQPAAASAAGSGSRPEAARYALVDSSGYAQVCQGPPTLHSAPSVSLNLAIRCPCRSVGGEVNFTPCEFCA